jgi:hypothetical protein
VLWTGAACPQHPTPRIIEKILPEGFWQATNITAQSSKKIPKKWLCVGAHALTHNHFFGYLWQ